METTKKPSRKPANGASVPPADKIRAAYKEHWLLNGTAPVSIYKFCLDLGIREEDFYTHFGSFEALERDIWRGFISRTIDRLQADESFAVFSAREKVLAFYYTLLEELVGSRSYILLHLGKIRRFEMIPDYMKTFKPLFENFIANILNEGQERGEIARRPVLDKRYPQLFWLHLSFILLFWRDDDSAGFDKTDAAVEKSVNLAFDLIGKGAVDSMLDFGKFLWQNRA
jgi:AcrR family transcriptional regulator